MNMKKIAFLNALLLTLISSAFAQGETDFSASATYGFESEYIFRGFLISGDTFTPSAEGRINNQNSTFYGGVRTALPSQKDDNKRKMNEYYLGWELDIADKYIVDIGVSHYEFLPFMDDSPNEVNLGFTIDTILSPSVYVYTDFDGEMTTYEGSVGHAFALDQKSAIMVTAYAGFSDFHVGSTYQGAMIDYSYSFTRYARFTIGGRIARLDPDAPGDDDLVKDTRVWWGVSFTAGF